MNKTKGKADTLAELNAGVGYLYDRDGDLRSKVPVLEDEEAWQGFKADPRRSPEESKKVLATSLSKTLYAELGTKVKINRKVVDEGIEITILEGPLENQTGVVHQDWVQNQPFQQTEALDLAVLFGSIDKEMISKRPEGEIVNLLTRVIESRGLKHLPRVWHEVDGLLAADFWISDSGLAVYFERDLAEIESAIRCYQKVGGKQQASILEEALSVYRTIENPEDYDENDPGWKKIKKLESKFYKIKSANQGWQLLEKFVRKHPEVFEIQSFLSDQIGFDTIVRKRREVRSEKNKEGIELDLDGVPYQFNDVGANIWAMIDGQKDIRKIADQVKVEYKIDHEQAIQDVLFFIKILYSKELILVK